MSILSSLKAWLRAPRLAVEGVTPGEAEALRSRGAVILDVRERVEYRRGHIPGALHVPLGDVESMAGDLPRDRPIVVHCAMGARSARAARILASKGFTEVRNLEGGLHAWEREGRPVEK